MHYFVIGLLLLLTHAAAAALGMAYKSRMVAEKDDLKREAQSKLGKL